MDVHSRTAANRARLADFFDSLDETQLATGSLCESWTVREVLGHLVMPFEGKIGVFVWKVVKARGSIDTASAAMASGLSRRPVAELTALLRDRAEETVPAPGVGPMGQLADGVIHLRDCARPLNLPDDAPPDDWRLLLDWLATGVRGLVPRRRLDGLHLVADDQHWSSGGGELVTGTSEALAMAVSGRPAALDDLHGPGVEILRQRLRR